MFVCFHCQLPILKYVTVPDKSFRMLGKAKSPSLPLKKETRHPPSWNLLNDFGHTDWDITTGMTAGSSCKIRWWWRYHNYSFKIWRESKRQVRACPLRGELSCGPYPLQKTPSWGMDNLIIWKSLVDESGTTYLIQSTQLSNVLFNFAPRKVA